MLTIDRNEEFAALENDLEKEGRFSGLNLSGIERKFHAPIHNELENFISLKGVRCVEVAVRAHQRAVAASPT